MNILMLGRGYIGGHLYDSLCIDHAVMHVGKSELDYHNPHTLKTHLKSYRPDLMISVFGFTGRPNIDQAERMKEECWHLNVRVPLTVRRICADMNIPFVHMSSGCIFNGYEREWTDLDIPNFGMFHHSSFYSKSKHAFELASEGLPGSVIRIRMPFSASHNDRNYLIKILGYKMLIDQINSRTCVEDMSVVVKEMVNDGVFNDLSQTFHIVNPEPMSTREIVEIYDEISKTECKAMFVEESSLGLAAPRSNCVLKGSVHQSIMRMPPECVSMRKCLRGLMA
jgi:dTDP-4-dehydrorhamnose reductase